MNPQNVLEQAKRYARGAFHGPGDWHGYRVPFLYASNGQMIWFLDVRAEKPVSRQLSAFHTAPALEDLFAFDLKPAHDWLLDTPPDILDGYLVDYEPVALKSHVRMNGVFLREGETVERVDTESGHRTEAGREESRGRQARPVRLSYVPRNRATGGGRSARRRRSANFATGGGEIVRVSTDPCAAAEAPVLPPHRRADGERTGPAHHAEGAAKESQEWALNCPKGG